MFNIINQFQDRSLILEMYPLDTESAKVIEDELSKLNQYKYLRFWE